jgi:hypothetical protein
MGNDDDKLSLEIVGTSRLRLTPVGDLVQRIGVENAALDELDTIDTGNTFFVDFRKPLYFKKNIAPNGTNLDEIARNLNSNGIYETFLPIEPINEELIIASVIGIDQYVGDISKTTFEQEEGKVVLTNGKLKLHVYDLDKHMQEYNTNVRAAINTNAIPIANRFMGAGKMAFNELGPYDIGFYVVEE